MGGGGSGGGRVTLALIKFTGGFDLQHVFQEGEVLLNMFSCIFQSRSEPPSSQFSFDFGISLELHVGPFGIILVHLFRS